MSLNINGLKDSCVVKNPEQVLDYLKEKSRIGHPGMMGAEVFVEKEMLRLASVYMEDLMYITGIL